jgi:hypothetical protein
MWLGAAVLHKNLIKVDAVTPAYNKTLYIQHDKENFQLPPEPHES